MLHCLVGQYMSVITDLLTHAASYRVDVEGSCSTYQDSRGSRHGVAVSLLRVTVWHNEQGIFTPRRGDCDLSSACFQEQLAF